MSNRCTFRCRATSSPVVALTAPAKRQHGSARTVGRIHSRGVVQIVRRCFPLGDGSCSLTIRAAMLWNAAVRTPDQPSASLLGYGGEHPHGRTVALSGVIGSPGPVSDGLRVRGEVGGPIGRIETFLLSPSSVFPSEQKIVRPTGSTISCGFIPSARYAALITCSLACAMFFALSGPIRPSWMRARLNDLRAGAGGAIEEKAWRPKNLLSES
jgi:hypothetical protein